MLPATLPTEFQEFIENNRINKTRINQRLAELGQLLGLNVKNKSVLDMGCGTGVLAILAKKMLASTVLAIDNDEWAYNNSLENLKLNGVQGIKCVHGDVSFLENKKFDLILANINLNILLHDLPFYKQALKDKGRVVFSGILVRDHDKLKNAALNLGLKFEGDLIKENWVCMQFTLNDQSNG